MTSSRHAPTDRITRPPLAAVLITVLAIAALVGGCSQEATSMAYVPAATARAPQAASEHRRGDDAGHPPGERPGRLPDEPPSPGDGASGTDDGQLPDGVQPFDDAYPGLTNLDPGLLDALREAAREARADDVTIHVNSGWRSAAYQRRLLHEADTKYGTSEEAARWVATVATSPHVSGDAVDVGDDDATDWLSEHGADYDLCQIYANEPWHFELRPHASTDGCAARYADASADPRMQP